MRPGSAATLVSGLLVSLAVGCSGDTTGVPPGGTGGTGGPGGGLGGMSSGTGGTGGGVSTADIDAVVARLNATLASFCNCLAAGAERDGCLATATDEALVVNDCQRAVLTSSEGQGIVGCVGGSIEDFETCMTAAACDMTAVQSCLNAMDSLMSTCDASYPTASAQLEACDPGSTGDFTCSDGESIPQSWICDGYPDCTMGEDEAGC